MTGCIGRKIGMTHMYTEDGVMVPVTLLQCSDQHVLQVKTVKKDGFAAYVVGSEKRKKDRQTSKQYINMHQFKTDALAETPLKKDDTYNVSIFEAGDSITVSSLTKGRGFQGVVKRHGFSGFPAGHGHRNMRIPGSIGALGLRRVIKGKKLPGHMGNDQKTVRDRKVIEVNVEKGIVAIKGSVAGSNQGVVILQKQAS
jgi:large subunit ribosomal protein L3